MGTLDANTGSLSDLPVLFVSRVDIWRQAEQSWFGGSSVRNQTPTLFLHCVWPSPPRLPALVGEPPSQPEGHQHRASPASPADFLEVACAFVTLTPWARLNLTATCPVNGFGGTDST